MGRIQEQWPESRPVPCGNCSRKGLTCSDTLLFLAGHVAWQDPPPLLAGGLGGTRVQSGPAPGLCLEGGVGLGGLHLQAAPQAPAVQQAWPPRG